MQVAQQYGITVDQLRGRNRIKKFCEARQLAMRRTRNELGYSFGRIGLIFDRDHTTVQHACSK